MSVLRQAQPLHLLLSLQRLASLGEGQGPRLLGGVRVRVHVRVCLCVCVNGGTHLFRARLQISS